MHMLSEKKVLEKLGIQDFRNMTKDKTVELVSLLDRMEPEVAIKAIEQFPNFANTSKEILSDYRNIIEATIQSNNGTTQTVLATYTSIINSLLNLLESNDISFEDKKYILEQIKEISDKIDKKDKENKRWLLGIASAVGTTIIGVVFGLATALGANANFKRDDSDEQNPSNTKEQDD